MNKSNLIELGLTPEALEKIGLKPEVLDSIIVLHGKGIEKFKSLQPRVDELESQLEGAKSTIAELKKVDPAKLEETIKQWEVNFKNAQDEWSKKEQQIIQDHAIERTLKDDFHVNDPAEVLVHIKRDQLVYKDGVFTGLKEQVEPLKEKKSYLFSDSSKNEEPIMDIVSGGKPASGMASFDAAMLKGAGLPADTKLS